MSFYVPQDVLKHSESIPNLSPSKRSDLLTELGFKRLKLAHKREVWKNVEKGLIIKHAFFLEDHGPRGLSIPTILLDDDGWCIQPLADLKDRSGALKEVQAGLPSSSDGKLIDLHYFNVGHYQGRAVMFDW